MNGMEGREKENITEQSMKGGQKKRSNRGQNEERKEARREK